MEVPDDVRYPIGRLPVRPPLNAADRATAIDAIAELPAILHAAVDGLGDAQLDTPYRADGWTVRQVVHHLADSHIHAYVRCKLIACEDNPTLKPYNENVWAAMPDAVTLPTTASLQILQGVHERWAHLLRSLDAASFARTGQHPVNGPVTLDRQLQIYSWHGRHHVAHITALRQRQGW
jgi:hypothetical protein